ncbi:GIY-YIG nuclease family protein [Candidatus Roizmanbacteria bacterium]|nr:GIY-YIG nuclease family protein [Candidatus Roizmanbacteria bacterium]
MFYTYILKLENNTYYIGYSINLRNRMYEHKKREVHQTKNRTFRLVFYAAFESKLNALRFEKYLKTGSGYAFKNKHLI